jgi:hypothetical protein
MRYVGLQVRAIALLIDLRLVECDDVHSENTARPR